MPKKKADQETFPVERWVYMGRRQDSAKKIVHAYRDENGETLLYKDKHRSVGALYEVEVKRDGQSARARLDGAKFVEAKAVDEETLQTWTVADRAAYTADEMRKAEQRAKNDASTWEGMTLSDLRENYQRLPHGQQTGMMAYVMRYMNGAV